MAHPHHLASPPFHIQTFKTGFVIICDRNGINWGLSGTGTIGFDSVEGAREWARRHELEMED